MNPARTYLDHNATAPLRPEARAAMVGALDTIGNPSSVHGEGRQVRRIVEEARERVAELVKTAPANVVFTSGATEANNWVLGGRWDTIVLPVIEHESVLAPARASAADTVEIGCDGDGVVNVGEIAEAVLLSGKCGARALITMQLANNETGVLQPVADVADFARRHGAAMHCDGVQAMGRVPVSFDALGVGSLSLSAHKIGGPMGVGALVIREGCDLRPLIIGGGQERRRRSGTENVAGIAGFGAAATRAGEEAHRSARLGQMRQRMEREILAMTPQAEIVGRATERLVNTCCITVPGTQAETLLIKFDLAGVALSSGSACSSGKVGASHVLAAMGLDAPRARGAIRISLGWNTNEADVDTFLRVWDSVLGDGRQAVA